MGMGSMRSTSFLKTKGLNSDPEPCLYGGTRRDPHLRQGDGLPDHESSRSMTSICAREFKWGPKGTYGERAGKARGTAAILYNVEGRAEGVAAVGRVPDHRGRARGDLLG